MKSFSSLKMVNKKWGLRKCDSDGRSLMRRVPPQVCSISPDPTGGNSAWIMSKWNSLELYAPRGSSHALRMTIARGGVWVNVAVGDFNWNALSCFDHHKFLRIRSEWQCERGVHVDQSPKLIFIIIKFFTSVKMKNKKLELRKCHSETASRWCAEFRHRFVLFHKTQMAETRRGPWENEIVWNFMHHKFLRMRSEWQ